MMRTARKKERPAEETPRRRRRRQALYIIGAAWMVLSYYGVEVYASRYLDPVYDMGLTFGFLWALLLTAVSLALPRCVGKVVYGLT